MRHPGCPFAHRLVAIGWYSKTFGNTPGSRGAELGCDSARHSKGNDHPVKAAGVNRAATTVGDELNASFPASGLIHHSDRGVQYASAEYLARLRAAGAHSSMSAAGNPYDNAKAESFVKTLKREEVYLNNYQTFHDAEENLDRFTGDVYIAKRLHSSLGYLPPIEFEDDCVTTMRG